MRVKLVDVDSKIHNLALMQISAYHKSLGDSVGFDVVNPDKVYVSCVFSKNAGIARGIKTLYPEAEIDIGGTGVSLTHTIPEPAQKIYPDYDLYHLDYSLGFTTRGCIRRCPFCVVPEKEGKIHRWQHVSEFHNPKFRKVHLLDNNMYADKEWFFENTDYVLEHNLQLSVTQGFDIRILTPEIAERLRQIRFGHILTFAFDNVSDEKAVLRGMGILKDAGFTPRNIQFYVLTGFNTSFEDDIHRVNLIRENGFCAFVMQYKKTQLSRMLARYANRRWVYWSVPFDEYKPYQIYQRKHAVSLH